VWYRGPLVAHPVDRDPNGPYHSADQARRISPETGAEDISYAGAFDLGRLLGAADGRLAQDLMGWRREAYRRSARQSVADMVWTDVPAIAATPREGVTDGMVAPVSLTMFERAGAGAGASADVNQVAVVRNAPGLVPQRLAAAWNLTPPQATRLLNNPVPDVAPPAPPPATDASGTAPVPGDDLQAARRRALGTRPPDPPEPGPEGGNP
jgi:hypothetical protein